jgi:transcriptional regulator with XRE-family HTH domain
MATKQEFLAQDFPQKLKNLRQSKGWSQGKLGQKIGIDGNRISRYERGALWPSLDLMVGLAKVFDVSMDYLVRSDKDMAISTLRNQELVRRIEQLDNIPEADQEALVRVLDAFIKKQRLEKVIQEDI